ncbi:MAG: NFACT RNA binding domain-containing protein [Candidatus Eremiobacteraeota bacterium]|nr:NFACT RNA binding domain-containing protein [Candidatus Eremiobacteraeota bacterium]
MTLDFWLVARLAKELDAALRGARIQSLAATAAGIVFSCYRRGMHLALMVSVDSSAPLVAAHEIEDPRKENGTEGWAAGVAALLRGATVDSVHAVPNDRVLYVDVSSRSPFGLPSRSRIVIELQPRKANALVLRPTDDAGWIIVAAAKQFSGSGDARSLRTGAAYKPPPAHRPQLDRAQFILAARDVEDADPHRFVRLLGEFDPACTPPLAREVVFRVAAAGSVNARALLDGWATLRREVEDALEESAAIFVVRDGDKAVAYHLVPLGWALAAHAAGDGVPEHCRVQTLNELCLEAFAKRPTQRAGPSPESLRKKLATLLARCAQEVASLEASRQRAAEADHFRAAGDEIYAHLAEIVEGADRLVTADGRQVLLNPLLTAKENATEYFRRYKKARSGVPRVDARLRTLRANREYWEQLAWELERADGLGGEDREALLTEIADALGITQHHQRQRPRRPRAQERRFELSGGAIALVGRSPKENERLTFTVAGSNDYWFHARGVPGAHVIVNTGGAEISPLQIEQAAALAAGHSRAAQAARVEVDYTQRKHVRRHASRRPGLVSYTDFATIRVAPRSSSV